MEHIKLEAVPFHQIEQLGLTRQQLEASGDLDRLLRGEKTQLLEGLQTKVGGGLKTFSAHLSLVRNRSGKYYFRIHPPDTKVEHKLAAKRNITLKKMPFETLEKYGITREGLKKSGDLELLQNGEKTGPVLVTLPSANPFESKKTYVRLFLVELPDKNLRFQMDFNANPLTSVIDDNSGKMGSQAEQ